MSKSREIAGKTQWPAWRKNWPAADISIKRAAVNETQAADSP